MLIAYVNRLPGLLRSSDSSRAEFALVGRFMEFLEDYILAHFQEEETCMHRFRCPAHQDAKLGHREFLALLRRFQRRFTIEGLAAPLVEELHAACVAWIKRHILRLELQLKYYQTEPLTEEEDYELDFG
jgi:hemerythrin